MEDWITSVWSYKDRRIKKLLWLLKFGSKFSVIEDLAPSLKDHIFAELSEEAIFQNINSVILVPIPITRKRLRIRGYNQSEIIAKYLCDKSFEKITYENLLEKIKDTPAQNTIKNRSARLKNLHGAYKVKDHKKIVGKNIILIDDIVTTGATLREAKKVLIATGAKKVLAFTIAH